MLELKKVGIWDRNKKKLSMSAKPLTAVWDCVWTFVQGTSGKFLSVTKIYMFNGIFLTGSWDISRHVCSDQNRYFKPKTRSFPHPNHMFLCINLTTAQTQPCHNICTKETKSSVYRNEKFVLQRQTWTSCTQVSFFFFYPEEYFFSSTRWYGLSGWFGKLSVLLSSPTLIKKHTAASLSLSVDSWETVPDGTRTPDTVR